MRIFWAFCGWTVVGVVFALPRFGSSGSWPILLVRSLGDWWSWGILVPLIVFVDRRLPIAIEKLGRRFGAHVLVGLGMTAIYVYVDALLLAALDVARWSDVVNLQPMKEALRGGFLWCLLVYLLIVGAWHSIRYSRQFLSSELRVERLERSYSEARLNTLRMQLDPHFLFNALNTISSQVTTDPSIAREMIEHLGDLLRLSLEPGRRQQVVLADELTLLNHYVAIQKVRFGAKVNVILDISATARQCMVPSLILQPLVENAVRHGLSSRIQGGTVTVTAKLGRTRLELLVEDDGVGLPEDWSDTDIGLGLSVTRERIAMLHPGLDAGLTIGRRIGGGTRVEIWLPQAVAKGRA